jgi:hypothetical protein
MASSTSGGGGGGGGGGVGAVSPGQGKFTDAFPTDLSTVPANGRGELLEV